LGTFTRNKALSWTHHSDARSATAIRSTSGTAAPRHPVAGLAQDARALTLEADPQGTQSLSPQNRKQSLKCGTT